MLVIPEYKQFSVNVHRQFGIDLSSYKETQMRRRLTSLRNQRGYASFAAYFDGIAKEKQLQEEFMDRLTINVTEFYRNPNRWTILQQDILPSLIKYKRHLRIWSAACSTGEEPYSLALMMIEQFRDVSFDIIATDIDEHVLQKAEKGTYKPEALKNIPSDKKSKYFLYKDNQYTVSPLLKQHIRFQQHNLLQDAYPKNVDLIVCRNVLIYFTDKAKEAIYQQFSHSLKDNCYLFVGSTEQIFNPENFGLQLYDTFFYQKYIHK